MTGAELVGMATMIRKKFAAHEVRYGFQNAGDDTVCDLDDVQGDAALAIWEHYMATKLGLAGRRSLYYAIGARSAGKGLKRVRSLVALSDHAIDKLGMDGKAERRVPLVGCGYVHDHDDADGEQRAEDPVGDLTATERVDAHDQEVEQTELLRAVASAGTKAIGRSRSAVARRVLGLGGRPLTMDEAARQTGRSKETLRKHVLRSFRQAVARDPAALAARRAIVGG